MLCNFSTGFGQYFCDFAGGGGVVFGALSKPLFEGLEQEAEGLLAVGVANREEVACEFGGECF